MRASLTATSSLRSATRARAASCRARSSSAGPAPPGSIDDHFVNKRGSEPMQRTKPPFRADHVGSFLRPQAVKEARVKRVKGQIGADALREIENNEIEKVIRKQEELGLKLATDGEYRRSWWHYDFFGMLDGFEIIECNVCIQFQCVLTKPHVIHIKNKNGFSNHPMIEHFKFLKAHTKVMPKMTVPSPAVMHFRLAPNAVEKSAYASRDDIFDD